MKRVKRELNAMEQAGEAINAVHLAALRSMVESRQQPGKPAMTYESASRKLANILGDFAKIAKDDELQHVTACLLNIRMSLAQMHGRWGSLRHAFVHLTRLERTHDQMTVLSTYACYFAVLARQGRTSEAAWVKRLAEERMGKFIDAGVVSKRSAARAMKIAFRDPMMPETVGTHGAG